VRLAEEARDDGDRKQDKQPRARDHERRAERDEGQRVLRHRQQLREEANPADGLSPRALEVVIEGGVLELCEVEGRRVLHEPNADVIREEVAEQTLDECRAPREHLAAEDDGQLERDQPPERRQVALATLGRDHGVDDELAHPQGRHGGERADDAEHDHRRGERAVCLPHESDERHDVAERVHARPPSRLLLGVFRRPRPIAERVRENASPMDGHGGKLIAHRLPKT
jgi:hypothetical protein